MMLPAVLPRTSVPVTKDGVLLTTSPNTKHPTVHNVSQRTSFFFRVNRSFAEKGMDFVFQPTAPYLEQVGQFSEEGVVLQETVGFPRGREEAVEIGRAAPVQLGAAPPEAPCR